MNYILFFQYKFHSVLVTIETTAQAQNIVVVFFGENLKFKLECLTHVIFSHQVALVRVVNRFHAQRHLLLIDPEFRLH